MSVARRCQKQHAEPDKPMAWKAEYVLELFRDDSILRFGGGTLEHPWDNAPGAIANRETLEACIKAHNERRGIHSVY